MAEFGRRLALAKLIVLDVVLSLRAQQIAIRNYSVPYK